MFRDGLGNRQAKTAPTKHNRLNNRNNKCKQICQFWLVVQLVCQAVKSEHLNRKYQFSGTKSPS